MQQTNLTAKHVETTNNEKESKDFKAPSRILSIGKVAAVTHGSRDSVDDDGSGYKFTKT